MPSKTYPTREHQDMNPMGDIPADLIKQYKAGLQITENIIRTITKAKRGIAVLKNHKLLGTVPRSIAINVTISVEKAYQSDMDKTVEEASKTFQTTILDKMIETREKELQDREKDLADKKAESLHQLNSSLGAMKQSKVIDDINRLKEWHDILRHKIEVANNLITGEVKIEEFFDNKRKVESMQKAQAERAERDTDQKLLDPAVQQMQTRLAQLEKQVKNTQPNKSKANPKAAQNPKKGSGPSKKSGDGPGKQTGKGKKTRTRKRKPRTQSKLHSFNSPIGIKESKLSKEAKLVLRVGHKFAFKANLRHSLMRCVAETNRIYGKRIEALSKIEHFRWHK